jgi:membrane protein required for colicin V production
MIQSLTMLDWFILFVVAGGILRGFTVGAVRQLASLVGVLLAFLLSVQFMHPVGHMVADSIGLADEIAPLVGFIVLFGGVLIVGVAVARLIERMIDALSLTMLNRVVGAVVGAVKAVLLMSVLFLVLASVQMPSAESRSASQLYSPVATALPRAWDATVGYLPAVKRVSEQFGTKVKEGIEAAQD